MLWAGRYGLIVGDPILMYVNVAPAQVRYLATPLVDRMKVRCDRIKSVVKTTDLIVDSIDEVI